jgi:hypothetical protein
MKKSQQNQGGAMKSKSGCKYKGFIYMVLRIASRVLPRYSSKYSKHTYTQPQLATALALMKRDRKSYRDMPSALNEVRNAIGLKENMPHFTTLHKFLERISIDVLDTILRKTYLTLLRPNEKVNIAIDSTGYSKRNVSYHYLWRIKGRIRHREHVKHSIAVDVDRQAIIAAIDRSNPYAADTKDFIPLVKKVASVVTPCKILADRGYDSEKNNEFCYRIGAKPLIPIRNANVPVWKTHGMHRKEAKRRFDWKSYDKRSLVETVNSVEKRLEGSYVSSRNGWMQKKELRLMDIVYNIHRHMVISGMIFYLLMRISTQPTTKK